MNKWNKKNSLWMLLYVVLYVIASYIVCAIGAIQYNWTGDVIGTVIMTFSTFGLYGQIWFNKLTPISPFKMVLEYK